MVTPDQHPDSPPPPQQPPVPLLGYVSEEDLAHSRLFGKLAVLLAIPVAAFILWILYSAVVALAAAVINLFGWAGFP